MACAYSNLENTSSASVERFQESNHRETYTSTFYNPRMKDMAAEKVASGVEDGADHTSQVNRMSCESLHFYFETRDVLPQNRRAREFRV